MRKNNKVVTRESCRYLSLVTVVSLLVNSLNLIENMNNLDDLQMPLTHIYSGVALLTSSA